MKKNHLFLIGGTLLLAACSSGNISDLIPDRRPDYRQSRMSNPLEVPPDLSYAVTDNQLNIPDLNPGTMATYSAYLQDNAVRDKRGYIQVLPELYGVQVIEQSGQLPYIRVQADASTTWQAVQRYWNNNGIRLKVSEPAIGLMETDWLENVSDTPSTGLSGLLNNLLGFISDSGVRDRYRISFSRQGDNSTTVTLLYSQSEETPVYDGNSREHSGFTWTVNDNDNPEMQLEMTRRIAIYISGELRRAQNITERQSSGDNAGAAAMTRSRLTMLAGAPALQLSGTYEQAWRNLRIGLDRASFRVLEDTYGNGTYKVRYEPQADAAKQSGSLWSKLWGKDAPKGGTRPLYHVRLAREGADNYAIVQNASGAAVPPREAQAVLETLAGVL